MKVLSLFDGMSCGMLAMQKAGVEVDEYTAYEIDKYAIQTATHNFPQISEHGDVFQADFTQYKGVDLIVGGSPCTYWSIAQKNNRETEASGIGWELFSQYVRAVKEAAPRFFIYENNKSMSDAIRKSITQTFGFEPVCINSALVSAQNRQRLYWVGKRTADGTYRKVPVDQPQDKGILLKDILDGITDKEKGRAVIGSAGRTTTREYFDKSQGNMSYEPVIYQVPHGFNDGGIKYGKSPTLTANGSWQCNNYISEPVGTTKDGKSYCLTSGYSYGSGEKIGNYAAHTLEKGCKSMVAEPVGIAQRGRYVESESRSSKCSGGTEQYFEARTDGKSNCISTVQKDSMVAEPVNITASGKSQTLKAQYSKSGAMNFCAYSSTYGASGIAEPVCVQEQLSGRKAQDDGSYDRRYEARNDSKSGTLTGTMRQNSLAEPVVINTYNDEGEKSRTCMAGYYKYGTATILTNKGFKGGTTAVAEPIRVGALPRPNGELSTSQAMRVYSTEGKSVNLVSGGGGMGGKTGLYAVPIKAGEVGNGGQGNRIYSVEGKSVSQTATSGGIGSNTGLYAISVEFENGVPTKAISCADGKTYTVYEVKSGLITIKSKQYPIKLADGYYIIRKLTVSECKRLQTVP